MPLLVVCGLPCSGRTTLARAVRDHLTAKQQQVVVHVVNEETLHIDMATGYASTEEEKLTRSLVKSEVERLILGSGGGVVVICDALCTYVKGFRYELSCAAKASGVTYCVALCDTPAEIARNRAAASDFARYGGAAAYDALARKAASPFEVPTERNRFDRPLIVAPGGAADPAALEAVHAALFLRQAPRPNLSTAASKAEETAVANQADRVTLDVIGEVLHAANSPTFTPGPVALCGNGTVVTVVLRRKVGMAELRRVRAQFMRMALPHLASVTNVRTAFADYLTATLL
eukprot:TRINITY_DN17347_c0_g1_i1.p1 TRINITY_DN17347_c0_g1~~TRINITY_DN17347_c0_g1_i1.p1  ORF type:complete len:289 (-),score=106.13 TRINITY_DN17347_c0_g1_i1:62-928(-)